MEMSVAFPLKVGRKDCPTNGADLQNPVLLDETAAAAFLGGLSIKTLQSWRLRGYPPPFIKVGRLVRYFRHDLLSFLETRRRKSTSEFGSRG